MGEHYSHLTSIQRGVLERMLNDGVKKSKIAEYLGVHVSTIYRELKRNSQTQTHIYNSPITYYSSGLAQQKYIHRRQRQLVLLLNKPLRELVNAKLKESWSPWQIEWYLKHENSSYGIVTHETIYRYIYSHWKRRNEFAPCLRRKRAARVKHGSRKKRIMNDYHISKRPESVNNRDEFGHWECDLMMFSKGSKANLITLVERKSRYLLAIKNSNKQSRSTAIAIIRILKSIKYCVSSITFDQGSEFADFTLIGDCLSAKTYFCSPGAPEEKGAIENRNGVIRTVLPRKHNIESNSQSEIDAIVSSINSRPMACLSYKSPNNFFESQRELLNELRSDK